MYWRTSRPRPAARAGAENAGEGGDENTREEGESLASVQKYDAPAESVTTPSLDALQAYSLGWQAAEVKKTMLLVPFHCSSGPFSLDPNFAMAYARWEPATTTWGQHARAGENTAGL